jgi:hypothetical protein
VKNQTVGKVSGEVGTGLPLIKDVKLNLTTLVRSFGVYSQFKFKLIIPRLSLSLSLCGKPKPSNRCNSNNPNKL